MSGRKDGSKDDLKNILMSFRIADLQTLLAGCGRSRSGRKHELLGRAMNLLKNSDGSQMRERVRTRILEIHNQRYPHRQYQQPYVSQYNSEKDQEPNYINRSSSYKQHNSSSNSHQSNYNSQNSHSQHTHNSHSMVPSNASIYNSNTSNNSTSYSTVTTNVPVHPDVKFITLPFFRKLDELVKPTSLVQKTLRGYQDMHVVFHLTPYQTNLINNSRCYIKSAMDYGVQIQLRFCLAEVSCVQEDNYPTRCKLVINGRGCTLPGQPPPNAQNQEPRKPHRPINITNFCRISPSQPNQIHIQWIPSDMGQRWATTINLVKTVPTESLIQQLKNKAERPTAHTIAFIKEKLKPDPDSEIALTSLKVSLCCPIGRTRMTMPCRAVNCNHLQCFDGSLYIQMNERKPSWVCPVCDQKAHYDSLFKDGMFMSILEQSPNCDEIMFFEDGSWRPASEIEESSKPLSQVVQTPTRQPPRSIECRSPPSPINIKTPPLTSHNHSASTNTSNPPPKMPNLERIPTNDNSNKNNDEEIEVICIDDSDDDDEPRTVEKEPSTQPPPLTKAPLYPTHGSQPPAISGFADPELQGLDLYNILPYEDRIAAAMHLDQNNFCGNLVGGSGGGTNGGGNSSRNSSASIIDISDE